MEEDRVNRKIVLEKSPKSNGGIDRSKLIKNEKNCSYEIQGNYLNFKGNFSNENSPADEDVKKKEEFETESDYSAASRGHNWREKADEEKGKYLCVFCDKWFISEKGLAKHLKNCKRKPSKIFICTYRSCEKFFKNLFCLKKHLMGHKFSFICNNCHEMFERKMELEEHILSNECQVLDILSCDICQQTFTQKKLLKLHIAGHAKSLSGTYKTNLREMFESTPLVKTLKYQCPECDALFASQESQNRHSHENCQEGQQCPSCGKVFRSIHFKNHIQFHFPFFKKCSDCCKVFFEISKFLKHLYTSCRSRSKHHSLSCSECDKTYSNLFRLKLHILKFHKFKSQENQNMHYSNKYFCEVCNKTFFQISKFKSHIPSHKDPSFKCQYCNYVSSVKETIIEHEEKLNCCLKAISVRLAQYNYTKCRFCLLKYKTEKEIIKHFETAHPGKKPQLCYYCPKNLLTFEDLQIHMLSHNSEKLKCDSCGRTYENRESLERHKTTHANLENSCLEKSEDQEKNLTHRKEFQWKSPIIKAPRRVSSEIETESESERKSEKMFQDSDIELESISAGWFDKYYKIEEDDLIFKVEADNNSGQQKYFDLDIIEKDKKDCPLGDTMNNLSSNGSSSESSDVDYELDSSVEYNPKRCRFCHITFSQECLLINHFIKFHKKEKVHECPKCKMKFPLFIILKEHFKTHGIGLKVYSCNICSKRLRSAKKLKRHSFKCKGSAETKSKIIESTEIQCKQYSIEKPSNGEKNLKNNDTIINNSSQYEGSEIDETNKKNVESNVADKLEEHLKIREIYEGFVCELCGKKFNKKFLLKIHILWHQGIEYKCNICSQKFLCKEAMEMHISKNNCKSRKFKAKASCRVCKRSFSSVHVLRQHCLTHIPNIRRFKPYKCNDCGRGFEAKRSFVIHKHLHTKAKPFCCSYCPKIFRHEGNLRVHEKSKHTKEPNKKIRPIKFQQKSSNHKLDQKPLKDSKKDFNKIRESKHPWEEKNMMLDASDMQDAIPVECVAYLTLQTGGEQYLVSQDNEEQNLMPQTNEEQHLMAITIEEQGVTLGNREKQYVMQQKMGDPYLTLPANGGQYLVLENREKQNSILQTNEEQRLMPVTIEEEGVMLEDSEKQYVLQQQIGNQYLTLPANGGQYLVLENKEKQNLMPQTNEEEHLMPVTIEAQEVMLEDNEKQYVLQQKMGNPYLTLPANGGQYLVLENKEKQNPMLQTNEEQRLMPVTIEEQGVMLEDSEKQYVMQQKTGNPYLTLPADGGQYLMPVASETQSFSSVANSEVPFWSTSEVPTWSTSELPAWIQAKNFQVPEPQVWAPGNPSLCQTPMNPSFTPHIYMHQPFVNAEPVFQSPGIPNSITVMPVTIEPPGISDSAAIMPVALEPPEIVQPSYPVYIYNSNECDPSHQYQIN